MIRMTRLLLTALALSVVLPAVASAQGGPGTNAAGPGVRLFFAADFNAMAASKSFDAVLGSSSVTALGGGADITNVWSGLFVRVAATRAKKDGDRAVIVNGQPVSLGIPVTITMTPIEVGGGWRFSVSPRVTPYVGAGALLMRYKESSPFATTGDDVSISKTGYVAFGGVEVSVARHIVIGGEAQYRSVPDAIGTGGVSKDFNEKDLGGFTMRVLVGVKL